jgi:beta-glucanase (GH16 family)
MKTPELRSLWSTLVATLALGLATSQARAQTVLLRDDFNGTTLDSSLWSLGTWQLGRTQLGNSPVVSGGIARLTFDTFQFRGTEIWSKANFAHGNGLEIAARLKLNNLPAGLVTSLFTYTYDNQTRCSDELDIEILTKQVNLTSGGDPVLFTTWNDWSEASPTYGDGVHHWSIGMFLAGLDVNSWHTYVIRWLPAKTEWLIDDVVVASSTKAQPDADTPVRLNFWAPASSWTDAYSPNLRPAKKANANVRYYYDVDWVEVRQLP